MAWWAWLAKLGTGAKAGAAKAAAGGKIAQGLQVAAKTSTAGSKIASGLKAAGTTQAAGGKIAAGLGAASTTQAVGGKIAAGLKAGRVAAKGVPVGKGLGAILAAGKEDVSKGGAGAPSEGVEDIIASTPVDTSILDSLKNEEAQKPYKPSAGDLGRQVGANIYEQGMSRFTGPIRTMGDIIGNKSMSSFANRVTDTTSFRSGGKLSYKPEDITPEQARERGLGELSQMAQQRGSQSMARMQKEEEDFQRTRREDLKGYYPNLF